MIIFPVIVLLQLAVLVFMIAKQEYILAAGEKILIQCEPVDPRSLFSGDYVILNYTITSIDFEKIKMKPGEERLPDRNETVYVALEKRKGEKFWTEAAASRDPEWLKKNYRTIIKGRINQYYDIRFGVEEYFVPQFEGKEIEREMDNVHVEVSIMPDRESAISRLFLNDREVKFY